MDGFDWNSDGIILPQNYKTLAAYEEELNASIESILAGETEI